MGRSAYSGRNWEGFSPDPYLSGVTMEKSVRGLQDAGVQATAKHWLLNEQEILRNPVSWPNGTLRYEALSSNVDDRTVRKYSSLANLFSLDLRANLISNRTSKRLLSVERPVRSRWSSCCVSECLMDDVFAKIIKTPCQDQTKADITYRRALHVALRKCCSRSCFCFHVQLSTI